MTALAKETGYQDDLHMIKMFYDWVNDMTANILTYRDVGHVSKYTKNKAPVPKIPFFENYDSSLDAFIN